MGPSNNGVYKYVILVLLCCSLVVFLLTQNFIDYDVKTFNISVPYPKVWSKWVDVPVFENYTVISENVTHIIVPTPTEPGYVFVPKNDKEADVMEARKSLRNIPEAPYIFGSRNSGPQNFNKTCAPFSTLDRLNFNNIYWQTESIQSMTYYLLNAYLDTREMNPNAPEVRIVLMADVNPSLQETCEKSYCQIWFNQEPRPQIVPVRECRPLWKDAWGRNSRYVGRLVSCPLGPSESHVDGVLPTSISLVQNNCDSATNNLHIHYELPETGQEVDSSDGDGDRLRFGVCVKGLDFLEEGKKPARMVEWIELLGIFGAEKIFIYEFSTHPNVKKVLDYYVKKGNVEMFPLTLPGTLPNEKTLRHMYISDKKHLTEKRKNEVITYNDCLYRNMYRFDFLALLDTDEILVPTEDANWQDLFNRPEVAEAMKENSRSTYCFRQLHFFADLTVPDVTPNCHMLEHSYRDINFTRPGVAVKCFHKTDRTQTLHNHFPFSCLGKCKTFNFDPANQARMQHYRSLNRFDNLVNKPECEGMDHEGCLNYFTSIDKTLWRFKDDLVPKVEGVMKEIGLI